MSCQHEWEDSVFHPDYEACIHCLTQHSRKALAPEEIYLSEYWSPKWEHGTIEDQIYNVEQHKENGLSKNQFALNLISLSNAARLGYGTALEVACAPGSFLRRLKLCGFERVIGVEADAAYEEPIRKAAACKVELLFGLFPEATKGMAARSCDLTVGMDIFEHAHEPQAFLAECARLLKSQGQLIIMAPTLAEDVSMPERFFHPIEHAYVHSQAHMLMLLKEAGFGAVEFSRWCLGHETISTFKT